MTEQSIETPEDSPMDTTTETPSKEIFNVETIILKEKERLAEKNKSIEVFKEVEPKIDAGNMLLEDVQPLTTSADITNSAFLKDLARDNAQLLFNELFKLPVERVDNVLIVKLPMGTTLLPRAKPVPKPKPPTKWEQYAAKKGIQNKKRSRMIWDEEHEAWKPRYGYKRANDKIGDWCIEVPVNADPMEDQFQKREDAKKESIAKNELKRLRNIAKNTKDGKKAIMSTQFKPDGKRDKETLEKEISIAKQSTASVGKFQKKLRVEKPGQVEKGKKRKFEATTGSMVSEKQRSMDIWSKVNKPAAPGGNLAKASNKKVVEDQFVAKKRKTGGTGPVKNKHARKGLKAKTNHAKNAWKK